MREIYTEYDGKGSCIVVSPGDYHDEVYISEEDYKKIKELAKKLGWE